MLYPRIEGLSTEVQFRCERRMARDAIPLNAQCLERAAGTSSKQGAPNLRGLMQL